MHRFHTDGKHTYWTDTVLFMTVGVLLAWGLVCGLTALTPQAGPGPVNLLLRAALVMAAYRLIFSHKYSVWAGGILLLIAGGVTAVDYLLNPAAEQYVRAGEFFSAVSGFLRGEQAAPAGLWSAVHWVGLLLAGLFLSVCMLVSFRFWAVAVASALVLLAQLSVKSPLDAAPFIAVTGCLLALYVRQCALTKTDRNRSAVVALAAIPAVLLCSAAAAWIPAPPVRLSDLPSSGVLKQPLNALSDALYAWNNPPGFTMEAAGYPVMLGGDIQLSGETMLEVEGASGLYLSGAVYDHYTGSSWVDTAPDTRTSTLPFSDRGVDMLERVSSNAIYSFTESNEFEAVMSCLEDIRRLSDTPYRIRAGDPEGDRLFIKMHVYPFKANTVRITVRQRQYALLKPPMTVGAAIGSAHSEFLTDAAGNILSGKLLTDGDSYSMTYRGDPSAPYWSAIYKSSRRGVLRDMLAYIGELRQTHSYDKEQISVNWSGVYSFNDLNVFVGAGRGEAGFDAGAEIAYEDLLADTLIPRADAIYEQYTALPSVYPERVKRLAKAIVEDADGDYQKALNIQLYLRQFPYTLSPGPVPEGRDFVDYFLFDVQKGYCTYFASAFVVLCRAAGLPARFVEGFSMTNATNEQGRYSITGENAHAWPEVYFEGYGWMTFEPTGSVFAHKENGPLGELYDRHMAGEFDGLGADFRPDDWQPDGPDAPEAGETGAVLGERFAWILAISLGVFMLALAIRPLWVFFSRKQKRRARRRMGDREAILCSAREAYRFLSAYRLTPEIGETVRRFSARAAALPPFDAMAEDLSRALDAYTRARYGGELLAEDRRRLEHAAAGMEAAVRRDTGRLRFWFLRYIRALL